MHILGVDYGQKRVGLAWVQAGLDLVLPYGNVSPEEVAGIIQKEGIEQVVIGLPLSQDGTENEHVHAVRAFAQKLQQETGVPVEEVDERFSSQLADKMDGDATRDEKAAMAILQTYIDKQ